MKFKYKRKTYIYKEGQIFTEKGNLAKDQDKLIRIAKQISRNFNEREFNYGMSYDDFQMYLGTLSTAEKEQLFHTIYECYLYAGEVLKEEDEKLLKKEFDKVMARLKKCELYLYYIIIS